LASLVGCQLASSDLLIDPLICGGRECGGHGSRTLAMRLCHLRNRLSWQFLPELVRRTGDRLCGDTQGDTSMTSMSTGVIPW
jgi:hypothetical protein